MTIIDRCIDKFTTTARNLPVDEQVSNLRAWLGEAYKEGRKDGEAHKGDVRRKALMEGYKEGYQRALEDAQTAIKSLTL